jgi:hypothetical protein
MNAGFACHHASLGFDRLGRAVEPFSQLAEFRLQTEQVADREAAKAAKIKKKTLSLLMKSDRDA